MNEKKLRLALIGKDVSQSDSPKIHAFILSAWGYELEYEKISTDASGFDSAMRYLLGDFDGFNVTIPYKRDVMEYLDEVVGDALAFGAVNTVVPSTRSGYNTDGIGFMMMLKVHGVDVRGKSALVLGAGGAGRSTAVALKNAGAAVSLYRRNREELEETCKELGVWRRTILKRAATISSSTPRAWECTRVWENPPLQKARLTAEAWRWILSTSLLSRRSCDSQKSAD